MAGDEIERWRPIADGIGDGVDARIILLKQTIVLNAVAGEGVVGVGGDQRYIGGCAAPAEADERLADV